MCCCEELTGEGSQVHKKETGCRQPGAAVAERCWEEKGVAILTMGCGTRSWGQGQGVKPLPLGGGHTSLLLLTHLCGHLLCQSGFGGQKQPGEVTDDVMLSFLPHSSEDCPHCVTLGRGGVAG